MGYENDPYVDEDGEPLMDPYAADDGGREPSPEPPLFDDFADEEDESAWRRDRSPTPVIDTDKSGTKPRKRLLKKGAGGSDDAAGADAELNDWGDEVVLEGKGGKDKGKGEVARKLSAMAKGGKEGSGTGSSKKRKERDDRERNGRIQGSSGKAGKTRPEEFVGSDDDGEREIEELWATITADPSEYDEEGVRNVDDDNFIDDTGVEPADGYGSEGGPGSPRHFPQAEEAEEDDEIERLFKGGKKKKKNERSRADIALIVEQFIAEFEVAAEEDAVLNRQSKPAINKLVKLNLLVNVLSKKNLQQEFLDHGILSILKGWLEPLPDGSLPNMNVRSAVLKILADFPIDLEQHDRREQLKKSGLGKVIMFLSKSDEETTANRKLAKELVDKWSRPIFNKSTRFEDMRRYDDERAPYRRQPAKKDSSSNAGMDSRDDDLETEISRGRKSGPASSRQHASRPEASPLDFVVRPQSKIDADQVRARAKQVVQDQRRLKMNKKLQQLKAPKKKNLQASKLSIEGRGMVKYL